MKRKTAVSSDLMTMRTLPAVEPAAKSPKKSSTKIHPSIPFTVAILILLYLGLNAWIYFYGTEIFKFNPTIKQAAETVSVIKKQGFGTITLVPTPTPPHHLYPLPGGVQEWQFSHGPGVTGPKIQTAIVDPLTPAKGGTQTVTITAKHDSAISATATLYTDTKHQSSTMKRTGARTPMALGRRAGP